MFCLRSWIPILFFLTNASPVYLLLFITATYLLNRPCVYCSLLLAILVLALFDFSGAATGNGSWFEPRYALYSASAPAPPSATATNANAADEDVGAAAAAAVAELVEGAASLLASAVNATAGLAADAARGIVGKRIAAVADVVSGGWGGWVRRIWRSGLRIECLGVTVRL